jgi:hypothetical protein
MRRSWLFKEFEIFGLIFVLVFVDEAEITIHSNLLQGGVAWRENLNFKPF